MSSPAQIAAIQRNAQSSTGPTSETGKTKSSLNAVKTGLTGRTVLLPGDDAALYEAHVARFIDRCQPTGDEEQNLVQSLADTEWRLLRIPSLEMGIYALGRLEFAELFPKEDEAVRNQLIEAKIFLSYQRQLNNLSIQENRLRRQREKDTAGLKELQEQRRRRTKARSTKPLASTSKLSVKIATISGSPRILGSNFHSAKSNFAPWTSIPISSPSTSNPFGLSNSPPDVTRRLIIDDN